jgi:hypothetical protein
MTTGGRKKQHLICNQTTGVCTEKTAIVHGNIRENNKDEDKIQNHLNENKPNYQKRKY